MKHGSPQEGKPTVSFKDEMHALEAEGSPLKQQKTECTGGSTSSASTDSDMSRILKQMNENQTSFLTSMQSIMQQMAQSVYRDARHTSNDWQTAYSHTNHEPRLNSINAHGGAQFEN